MTVNVAQLFGIPRRRATTPPPVAANAALACAAEAAKLRARVAELEVRQARHELAYMQAQGRIRERCEAIAKLPQHRQEAALAQALAGDMAADLAVVARHGMSGVGARPKPLGRGAA